ncbi:hypothetical protein [Paenibacillus protaetiae]|uniref:Uncharacterized protein n=1 Tax=Paenibacillus protaetiae TaxID=2509456 RepID=A0A4P6ETX6_9BACL|nr:hypothetical protein [Paenibacillus protaetiae]QAY66364.1 hypothetical protein ET464_08035 [Paenibacillus protaetiae]
MNNLFIPENYADLLRWLKSYNEGNQILQATGLNNFNSEGFLAKMNKAHTGFCFLSLDSKGLMKGEFIINDKPNNCVSLKRINLKDIIGVECNLSNYGRDFIGFQFQKIYYSLSILNNEKLVLISEDYTTDSNQKFMEIGNRLMNSVG